MATPQSEAATHVCETGDRRRLIVQQGLREKNDQQAELNRALFREKKIRTLNILSSPGSGKTTLLARTMADLRDRLRAAVIVGDLATDNDARRLHEAGVDVVQINTGKLCHLEAPMVARAMEQLDLEGLNLLVIENVGNLVCPASYDLGEELRVVLLSVTEGEDKPLKYPHIFRSAHLVLITKIELADLAGFDRSLALDNIASICPDAEIIELSARAGLGLDRWYERLMEG